MTRQSVDQTGFADIRPACEYHLRNPFTREVPLRDGAYYKFSLDHRNFRGLVSDILAWTNAVDLGYIGHLSGGRHLFESCLQNFIHCFH